LQTTFCFIFPDETTHNVHGSYFDGSQLETIGQAFNYFLNFLSLYR
jgi:hypothetical protein